MSTFLLTLLVPAWELCCEPFVFRVAGHDVQGRKQDALTEIVFLDSNKGCLPSRRLLARPVLTGLESRSHQGVFIGLVQGLYGKLAPQDTRQGTSHRLGEGLLALLS